MGVQPLKKRKVLEDQPKLKGRLSTMIPVNHYKWDRGEVVPREKGRTLASTT